MTNTSSSSEFDLLSANQVIPPRKNAKLWQRGNSQQPQHSRDEVLRAIRKTSRRAWKDQADYHIRSFVEATIHRLNAVFGGEMRIGTCTIKKLSRKSDAVYSINLRNLGCPFFNGISQQSHVDLQFKTQTINLLHFIYNSQTLSKTRDGASLSKRAARPARHSHPRKTQVFEQ